MLLSNLIDIDRFDHFSFDLWLTIIKSHPEYKKKRCLLVRDFFSIPENLDTIGNIVRSYDVLCNNISEKTGGHIPMEQIIFMILNDLNIDIDKIENRDIQEFYQESEKLFMEYKPILLYNEIYNIFHMIKEQGKTMNISSNTAFIRGSSLRKILEFYDIEKYFSFQIYSDELGYSKPNPIFFEKVFNEAKQLHPNIVKEKVVHIGDNPIADGKGASEYGLQTILIQ